MTVKRLWKSVFKVNHKRVERIWRQQGLKVPKKQKKRRRLWLNDGSAIRLRPEYKNHVWSYDIMEDKTYDGRKFRILNIIDEYSRECLLSFASRRITSREVVEFLADLFCSKGLPEYIRSDNVLSLKSIFSPVKNYYPVFCYQVFST